MPSCLNIMQVNSQVNKDVKHLLSYTANVQNNPNCPNMNNWTYFVNEISHTNICLGYDVVWAEVAFWLPLKLLRSFQYVMDNVYSMIMFLITML